MTLAEFVPQAFRAATGKLPTFGVGSTKWNNIVASGNFYIQQWAREPKVDWNSLYDPAYSAGTVTATDTFDLDDDVRKISDQEDDSLRIIHTRPTQYTDYALVTAPRLKAYPNGNYAAQVGRTIKFNRAFTSSFQQFGGEIFLPVYLFPDAIANPNDPIVVDDPNWLVLMVAADYVRNDITRKDLRADLVAEANQTMQRMKDDNEAQISTPLMNWNPLARITDDTSY